MSVNQGHIKNTTTPSVLITGGSGLIGRYLTSALLNDGYKVSHLSRKTNQFGKVRVHRWDPEKEILDPAVFEGVDHIVHLAGANIGERRWTSRRQKEIVDSRVNSTRLLHRVISENNIPLKTFVSASAIGYYGLITSGKIFNEKDPPGNDFLGNTCRLWEEGADLFSGSGIRIVKIRTAVVLEKTDSALSKLMAPSKYGFLVQTGSGNQYMPWIHIDDLCNSYLKAITDIEMEGVYNAVSPQHVTLKEFIKTLSSVIQKPVFPIPVPAFFLRAVMGKMSGIILEGSRVSSEKIRNSGFKFQYPDLMSALRNIIQ